MSDHKMPTYCNQKKLKAVVPGAWNLGQLLLNLLQWSLDCLQLYPGLAFAHWFGVYKARSCMSLQWYNQSGVAVSFLPWENRGLRSYPKGEHYSHRTLNNIHCFHIHNRIWLSNWENNPPNSLLPVPPDTHSNSTGWLQIKNLNGLLQMVVPKLTWSSVRG